MSIDQYHTKTGFVVPAERQHIAADCHRPEIGKGLEGAQIAKLRVLQMQDLQAGELLQRSDVLYRAARKTELAQQHMSADRREASERLTDKRKLFQIRRALETEFTGGTALIGSRYAGIAQQYIFEYIRRNPEKFVKSK